MNEVLSQVLEIIKGTKDFVLAQAPDVCRQMIVLARVESIASFVVWAIAVFLFYKYFKYVQKMTASREWDEFAWVVPIILGLILLLYTCCLFTCGVHELLTAWFAPKVYLIEHITHLMKGGQ